MLAKVIKETKEVLGLISISKDVCVEGPSIPTREFSNQAAEVEGLLLCDLLTNTFPQETFGLKVIDCSWHLLLHSCKRLHMRTSHYSSKEIGRISIATWIKGVKCGCRIDGLPWANWSILYGSHMGHQTFMDDHYICNVKTAKLSYFKVSTGCGPLCPQPGAHWSLFNKVPRPSMMSTRLVQ